VGQEHMTTIRPIERSKLLALRLYYEIMSGTVLILSFLVLLIIAVMIYPENNAIAIRIMSVGLLVLAEGVTLRAILFGEYERRRASLTVKR